MSKRPRAKKKRECANPLYLKWLEEWRDEAREKGSKMQHTYSKAISSLKKYPLPLSCGEEAKILDGIGGTIAHKLDEAYRKYLETSEDDEIFIRTNVTSSTDASIDQEDDYAAAAALHVPLPEETARNVGQQTAKSAKQSVTSTGDRKSKNIHQMGERENRCTDRSKESKRQKKTREYIPAYRSGAYALLVTLYRKSQQYDYRGYMSKAELQREAQPLSETSLTLPDPGSQYSAWSSMSTLIRKGYVLKTSSPAKYAITDAGCELAEKLEMASDSQQPSSSSHPIVVGTSRVPPLPSRGFPDRSATTTLSSTETIPRNTQSDFTRLKTHNRPSSFPSLRYWYISENGKCTKRKDEALVSVNDTASLGFLIKCEMDALMMSSLRYSIDNTRPKNGRHVYAYLQDEDAAEFCTADETDIISIDDDDDLPRFELDSREPTSSFTKVIPKYGEDSEITNGRTTTPKEANFTPEIILKPGSFEIVLCVDNVETIGGSSNSRKKELVPELQRNGVKFDVRKLHVGDFLWVAQEKTSSIHILDQRQRIPPRELVLDYVIERKRMDDLCSSIIDGRFKEQKYRLNHSGLRNPIYLVEDFGSIQHMSLPEATLQQAIVNTQVVDGFTVKRTSGMKESVAYLTIMTRYLQSLYSGRTLISCPRESVKELYPSEEDNFSKFDRSEVYLMTFSEFNESTVKNRVMTVGEVFAKQLMQIGGISADKAVAILEKYPTPWSLLQAYEAQATEKDRELMLASLKSSKSQRNFGPAISKLVYMLYCSQGPLR